MSLEHFVNNVRALSAAANFRELLDYLNASAELLSQNQNILDNVMETLDTQAHSIAIIHLLTCKFALFAKIGIETVDLVKQTNDFIYACNWLHIRVSLLPFAELCHTYTKLILKLHMPPMTGIKALHFAVEKLRTSKSQLTPIHADLCLLCLRAKYFKPALAILDVDITAISTTEPESNHDTKYVLLYYYYGGMIYSAVKSYERAMYFFEATLSMPAAAMSYIMLEAYKKFILVSLICEGKIGSIPKYSSPIIPRFIKPICTPYLLLAKAYEEMSSMDLNSIVSSHHDTFVHDNNMGLVNLVVASIHKQKIHRLTQTFLTLSLADVADKVRLSGPDEAERYILMMVKDGEIFASINKKDGMVVFKDDPEKFNTPATMQLITTEINQVIAMNKHIVKMDEEIKMNPQFVKKCISPQEDELLLQTKGQFPDRAE